MSYSTHMDGEYEKFIRRMNPPRYVTFLNKAARFGLKFCCTSCDLDLINFFLSCQSCN